MNDNDEKRLEEIGKKLLKLAEEVLEGKASIDVAEVLLNGVKGYRIRLNWSKT